MAVVNCMFSGFFGETVVAPRQKPPKDPFFEIFLPKALVKNKKSSYILTEIQNKEGKCYDNTQKARQAQ